MDLREGDSREVLDLGIERVETTLGLEPSAVVGKWDGGPRAEVGPGELEGQGETPKQTADSFGLGAFWVVLFVTDGVAGGMAE
jgi:hypothetical protein